MPRYFFETHDGDAIHVDAEGLELADKAAARLEALRVFSDMARDKIPDRDHRTFSSVVPDEAGNVVYAAPMSLAGRWGTPLTLVPPVDRAIA